MSQKMLKKLELQGVPIPEHQVPYFLNQWKMNQKSNTNPNLSKYIIQKSLLNHRIQKRA